MSLVLRKETNLSAQQPNCLRLKTSFVCVPTYAQRGNTSIPHLGKADDARVDPKFEDRKDFLVAAAQSTCFIAVKCHQKCRGLGTPSYRSGTAFFVSPTILLTAAHIVHDHKDTIVVELPGTLKATAFLDRLFQPSAKSRTIMCKLLETGHPDADVSVLEVVGE